MASARSNPSPAAVTSYVMARAEGERSSSSDRALSSTGRVGRPEHVFLLLQHVVGVVIVVNRCRNDLFPLVRSCLVYAGDISAEGGLVVLGCSGVVGQEIDGLCGRVDASMGDAVGVFCSSTCFAL
ncbi:unnamed protein product [Ectocarpus sp. 12 AP-2014]